MPSCGYCGDCKWWDTRAYRSKTRHPGICGKTRSAATYWTRGCKGEEGGFSRPYTDKATMAFAVAMDGIPAFLRTSSGFGCVQWEKKEEVELVEAEIDMPLTKVGRE